MKPELRNGLLEYLGYLLHKHDTTFDWIEKDEIIEKLNAVYVLLNIGEPVQTTLDKISAIIKAK